MEVNTFRSRLNAAEICRANGWTTGTVLRGTESWPNGKKHTCDLLVTAVGESTILGRCLTCGSGHETCWHLTSREWKQIENDEVNHGTR